MTQRKILADYPAQFLPLDNGLAKMVFAYKNDATVGTVAKWVDQPNDFFTSLLPGRQRHLNGALRRFLDLPEILEADTPLMEALDGIRLASRLAQDAPIFPIGFTPVVSGLLSLSEANLLDIRGFGKEGLQHVKRRLAMYGIRLGRPSEFPRPLIHPREAVKLLEMADPNPPPLVSVLDLYEKYATLTLATRRAAEAGQDDRLSQLTEQLMQTRRLVVCTPHYEVFRDPRDANAIDEVRNLMGGDDSADFLGDTTRQTLGDLERLAVPVNAEGRTNLARTHRLIDEFEDTVDTVFHTVTALVTGSHCLGGSKARDLSPLIKELAEQGKKSISDAADRLDRAIIELLDPSVTLTAG